MASVNKTIDLRTQKTATNGSLYLFGSYYRRVSSGGDRSAADKAAGLYPEHAYTCTITDRFSGESTYWTKDFGVEKYWTEAASTVGSTLVRPWTANDDIALLGQLAAKYRQTDWNLGIFVAELGKTVDSVASRAKQLARAAIAVKRLNVSLALAILKAKPSKNLKYSTKVGIETAGAAELWLELRYAWRPLLKDIFDLCEAIQNLDQPRVKVIKVRRSIKKTIYSGSPSIWTASGSGFYGKSIKAFVTEQPFSFPEYLGLSNPESIAWEIVPLSFVADWFIPIGNYLETRNTISRMGTGLYVSTTYDWHRGKLDGPKVPGNQGTPAHLYRYISTFGYDTSVTVNRTLSTSLNVPLPVFRNPDNGKAARALDAITLFTQVIRSMTK